MENRFRFIAVLICIITISGISRAESLTTPTVNFQWEKKAGNEFKTYEYIENDYTLGEGRSDVSFISQSGISLLIYGGLSQRQGNCGTINYKPVYSIYDSDIEYINFQNSQLAKSDLWILTSARPKTDKGLLETRRAYSDHWMDSEGNVYIYGGRSYHSTLSGGFSPCPGCNPICLATSTYRDTNHMIRYSKNGIWSRVSDDLDNTLLGIDYDYAKKSRGWTDSNDNLWLFVEPTDQLTTTSLGLLKFSFEQKIFEPVLRTLSNESQHSLIPKKFTKAATWTDNDGNLWLFGDGTNTMWKFDIEQNAWFEMNKPSSPDMPFNYGSRGIFSDDHRPGERTDHAFWKGEDGNFWIYGGFGEAEDGIGNLNDLWKYDVTLNQWAWVSGSPGINDPGIPFTIGSGNAIPAADEYLHFWVDGNGRLNMFGGKPETDGDTTYTYSEYWVGTEIP